MKKILFVLIVLVILLSACAEADVASRNVSKAADNFEVSRRIVIVNGITDEYLLVVEGLCSLGNYDPDGELSITCKVAPNTYYKHFVGLSDNVTYVSQQIEPATVDPWHYRIIYRPSVVIPDIEIQTR